MGNKIYTNHTLEEYNKKYGNKNLKKVKKLDADKNPKLLSDHSWWLIKDTYYEIPNNKGFKAWWHNLGKGGQIALCALLGCVVAAAVVVPTVIVLNQNKTVDHKAVIDPEVKDVTCTQKKLENGALEVTLNYDTTKKELADITVKIGNQTLLLNTDYTLEGNKIVIAANVLSGNKATEIVIKPILQDKKTIYATGITCDESKEITVGGEISFDDLHVKITPDDATDKTFSISAGGKTNDEDIIEIDEANRKIKAKSVGDVLLSISANGADPEGEKPLTGCMVSVKDPTKKYTVSLSDESKELAVGNSFNLKATITENGEEPTLFWGTSGAKANAVELTKVSNTEYTVTAKEPGSCNISVGCTGGNTAICEVTVKNVFGKKEFLDLYDTYRNNFLTSTLVYEKDDINKFMSDTGKTKQDISEVKYELKGSLRVCNVCFKDESYAPIGTNDTTKDMLSILLGETSTYSYDETTENITAVFQDGKKLVVNKYGYLIEYGNAYVEFNKDPHEPKSHIVTKAEWIKKANELNNDFLSSKLEYTVDQLTYIEGGKEKELYSFLYEGTGKDRKLNVYLSEYSWTTLAGSMYSGDGLEDAGELNDSGTYEIYDDEIVYKYSAAAYDKIKELHINKYGYLTYREYGIGLSCKAIWDGEPKTPLTPIKLSTNQLNINIAEEDPKIPTLGVKIDGFTSDIKDIKVNLDVDGIITVDGPRKPEAGDDTAWLTVELCTPRKTGEVNITVSCDGYKSAVCKVTVVDKAVVLDETKLEITVGGESATISATLSDKGTGKFDCNIEQEGDIVEVKQNQPGEFTITGKEEGEAVIEITCVGYASAYCSVTVEEGKAKIQIACATSTFGPLGISVEGTTKTLEEGGSVTFSATNQSGTEGNLFNIYITDEYSNEVYRHDGLIISAIGSDMDITIKAEDIEDFTELEGPLAVMAEAAKTVTFSDTAEVSGNYSVSNIPASVTQSGDDLTFTITNNTGEEAEITIDIWDEDDFETLYINDITLSTGSNNITIPNGDLNWDNAKEDVDYVIEVYEPEEPATSKTVFIDASNLEEALEGEGIVLEDCSYSTCEDDSGEIVLEYINETPFATFTIIATNGDGTQIQNFGDISFDNTSEPKTVSIYFNNWGQVEDEDTIYLKISQ